MTPCPVPRPRVATSRGSRTIVAACLLSLAWAGAGSTVRAQADARAQANQLHAAIANGDVESLKYWLTVRHADPSAANDTDAGVTPLGRCLGLAARVLDPGVGVQAHVAAAPVGLRALQDMVMLLHEHGARLSDADRHRFSGPVLRWYDDAVSSSAAAPDAAAAPPPAAPAHSPALMVGGTSVMITADAREPCNGTGHTVYLVNQTLLSVTARVTMHEDAAPAASGSDTSQSYTVDPQSPWRLGCDVTKDGRRVRYELSSWR